MKLNLRRAPPAAILPAILLLLVLLLNFALTDRPIAPGEAVFAESSQNLSTTIFWLPFIGDGSTLVINEFMASNGTTIADEDGDFSDWIEIYYRGARPVSLAGYGLSDNDSQPFRWTFPDVTLQPDSYLLVWASGKDRATPGGPLHSNFSVSSSGEPLLLTRPDGARLDRVGPLSLGRDVAYGRQPDGANSWFYFTQPTPGRSNSGVGYAELLDPPIFSHQGGFFTEPFALTLATASPGAQIVYTLDGSIPDLANLHGRTYTYKNQYPQNPDDPFGEFLTGAFRSYHYNESIPIVNRAAAPDRLTGKSSTFDREPTYFPQEPVFKGTVVRAQVVKPGALPSPVVTRTYFVTPDGRDRYSLPVVSLAIQEDALFDYERGIYTAGEDFDSWRVQHPDQYPGNLGPANYRRDTEYPAHIEFLEASGLQFSQDIGVRIHGAWSRALRLKSLRLYARSQYGASDLAYPLFADPNYNSYRRVILRNSGHDFERTMFRDAAIQAIVAPLNFDTQAYRPVIVFINGEYWGIHNLRERYDRHYLERVYGIEPDNIDLLERYRIIIEGDAAHYDAMLAYIRSNGVAEPGHYAYIQTQMDSANFIDYQIAQIFANNTDWPGNNIKYWRYRTDAYVPDAPYGHDGRWRWLLYDMDFGFGYFGGATAYTHDMLAFATADDGPGWPNPPWSTFLFRALLTNEQFEREFINRFADLLNTLFLPDRTEAIIDLLKQGIEPEMAEHIQRWSQPHSLHDWGVHIERMLIFARERPYYQRLHLEQHFNLAGQYNLTVNLTHPERGYVRVNTIDLLPTTAGVGDQPYPWTGVYFRGVPIELEATAAPGYRFAYWEGLPPGTPAVTEQIFHGDVSVTAVFAVDLNPQPELLYYWHFNNLPNNETIASVPADYALAGAATITYPGVGAGYMDRVTDGSTLNLQLDEPPGYALRVRNPSDGRELRLALPTVGYEEIILRYAVKRTPNGATEQTLYYRTDPSQAWIQFGESFAVSEEYALFVFDFGDIPEAADNPHFAVRVLFGGAAAAGSSGNNRFDNISLNGRRFFHRLYLPLVQP